MAQSFQEWLKQVLTAIKPPPIESALHSNSNSQNMVRESDDFMPFSYPVPDALSPAWMSASINGIRPEIYEETNSSCQKLLFSATLTRDPAKIASLELRNPRYIIVRGKASEIQEDAMDIDESHYMETFETPSTLRVSDCNASCQTSSFVPRNGCWYARQVINHSSSFYLLINSMPSMHLSLQSLQSRRRGC